MSGGGPTRSAARRGSVVHVGLAAAGAIVTIVAFLGPVLGRVAWERQHELQRATAAVDVEHEIAHLGRAARWHLPWEGVSGEAWRRLEALGDHSDPAVALEAARETRRARLAIRSWRSPNGASWSRINERIVAGWVASDPSVDPERELDVLLEPIGPSMWRANLAAWAFVAWLVALAMFARRGLGPGGWLRPKAAVRWGLGSLVWLGAWMILLRYS